MLPIHVILHPTDFSERSQYAFQLACALARDYDARLIVLHVTEPPAIVYGDGVIPPDPEMVIEEVNDHFDRLKAPDPAVAFERRSAMGDPTTEILQLAQEVQANLIVMGTHGRTGLARLLMGSVAEQVVRRAICPVLTVAHPVAVPVPAGAGLEGAAI